MVKACSKFGGRRASVRNTRLNKVVATWTRNKGNSDKTKKKNKKDPLLVFTFFLEKEFTLRLELLTHPGRFQGSPFGPRKEPDSLFLADMGSNRSISTNKKLQPPGKDNFFGVLQRVLRYYGGNTLPG